MFLNIVQNTKINFCNIVEKSHLIPLPKKMQRLKNLRILVNYYFSLNSLNFSLMGVYSGSTFSI